MTLFDENTLNKLGEVKDTNYEKLKRMNLGVDYNFEESATKLKSVADGLIAIMQHIEAVPLSDKKKKQVGERIRSLASLLERIKTFQPSESQNPNQDHKNLVKEINGFIEHYQDHYSTVRELLILKKIDPEGLLENWEDAQKKLLQKEIELATQKENLEALVKSFRNESEERKITLENVIKESEETLQDFRNTLGERGAEISGKDFEDQAEKHEKNSKRWLAASAISIAVTFWLVIMLFHAESFQIATSSSNAEVASAITYKLLILSILYIIIKQCIKNYRVNAHLEVVNRHRQLSLTVYPFMVDAAKSNADVIVAHASKAIFDTGTTGHLDKEESKVSPVNPTEIFTNIINPKG